MDKKINKRVLIPIPTLGADPSEVAIPWKLFTQRGFEVVFCTPDGEPASVDQIMLKGSHLGILKPVLAARRDAVDACIEMEKCSAYRHPLKYSAANAADFDALHLPGGHDKTVKPYLESKILQKLIADFFAAAKPVAAICHGVVLVARSKNPNTGKSVLEGYQTTALLKFQELTGYNLTRLWMKDYYLTYPEITVEDEVRSVLADQKQFHKGPIPLLRDDEKHLARGFALRDRNFLSARWPGDLYTYSHEFIKMIEA